jgi:hypothetical protein
VYDNGDKREYEDEYEAEELTMDYAEPPAPLPDIRTMKHKWSKD